MQNKDQNLNFIIRKKKLPKEGQTLHCELFSGNKIVQHYGYSSFAVIRYNFLQKKCLYEVALTQKAKINYQAI